MVLKTIRAAVLGCIFVILTAEPVVVADDSSQPRGASFRRDTHTVEPFTFAVIGDTRPGSRTRPKDASSVSIGYMENILWMNRLDPDFSVNVGDMIVGYNRENPGLTERQWDEFETSSNVLAHPAYMVAGNHDVWDEQSAAIYRRRFGPLYYSFQYKGCQFLCLSAELPGAGSRIGEKQLAWLERELSAKKDVRHRFVFLHKPLWWTNETGWLNRVHPLLKKYEVDTVFAGHEHLYEYREIDGIRYVVTGGGGAELPEPRPLGGFFHFLVVSVDHVDRPQIKVIEKDRAYPQTIITAEKRGDLADFISRLTFRGAAPWGKPGVVELSVRNSFEHALTVRGSWDLSQERQGVVTPRSIEPFVLAPGETKILPFQTHLPEKPDAPPTVKMAIGGEDPDWDLQVALPLDTARRGFYVTGTGKVPRAALMAIDSRRQLGYDSGGWGGPQDCSGVGWIRKEADGFRIRVEVTDDKLLADSKEAWSNDAVELYFDLRPADKRGAFQKEPGWFQLIVVPNIGKAIPNTVHQYAKTEKSIQGITLESDTTGSGYWVEVFVPFAGLKDVHGLPGKEFGFDYSIDDSDKSHVLETQIVWSGGKGNSVKPAIWGHIAPIPAE